MSERSEPNESVETPPSPQSDWKVEAVTSLRAIALRSLTTGKFWQFVFGCVLIFWVRQIDSADWVKIAELFVESELYCGLGWSLWVATILIAVAFHRIQRRSYLAEIERLVEQRHSLEEKVTKLLGNSNFKSSKTKRKK